MLKKIIAIAVAAVMICAVCPATYAEDDGVMIKIYVDAENGSDGAAGTFAAPFQTISRAAETAKELCGSMTGNIEIILKNGIYYPDFTYEDEPLYNYDLTAEEITPVFRENISVSKSVLDFDETLSGKNGYKIVFKAENANGAIISGARRVTGWELYDSEKNIYRAPSNGIKTRQLYVNGEKQQRARTEILLGEKTDIFTSLLKTSAGYTAAVNGMENWKNKDKIEFVYLTPDAWYAPRVKVKSIAAVSGKMIIEMTNPAWELMLANRSGINTVPAYVENAYELIDKDGEWYLDETEQYFYYKAPLQTDMAAADVSAPVVEKLLQLEGTSASSKISNIKFEGLVFEGTTYLRPESANGYIDAQSNTIREIPNSLDAIHPTAAVTLTNAADISFEGCVFNAIGSDCLQMAKGTQNISVTGGGFTDIAESAVIVGLVTEEYRKPKSENEVLKNIAVSNNYISNVANEYYSGVAVSVGLAGNTTISNNEISNCSYSALHIGWGLYDDTELAAASDYGLLKNIKILYNKIYDTNQILSDGAPIYVRGKTGAKEASPNIIKGNYLRRNGTRLFSGMYFDTAVGSWSVSENVIESVRRAFGGQALKYHFMGEKNYCRVYGSILVSDVSYNSANVIKVEGSWPEDARRIIQNAGITEGYAQLRGYSEGELFNVYVRQDVKAAVGEETDIPVIAEDVYGNEINSGVTYEYFEGEYLTENVFQHSLLDSGKLEKMKSNDLYSVNGNGKITPLHPQQSAIWVCASDQAHKQRAMYTLIAGEYIEAENLTYVSDVEVSKSSESPIYHYPKITEAGQYIEYDIEFPSEGIYEIWFGNVYKGQISMKSRASFGIYRVTVEGYQIGDDVDFYINSSHNVYLGKCYVSSGGMKKLRFECVGKNNNSNGYRMAADSFCLYCTDNAPKKEISISGKNFEGTGNVSLVVKNAEGEIKYADQAVRTGDNSFGFKFMLDVEPGRFSVNLGSKNRDDVYADSFELAMGNGGKVVLDSFSLKNSEGNPADDFNFESETEISLGLKRTDGAQQQVSVIMALYNADRLIHMDRISNLSLSDSAAEARLTYTPMSGTSKVSIYIWDGALTPLFDAIIYEPGENILVTFG